MQSLIILFFTTLATLSFVPIIVVLLRLHKRRGQDIVLTVVAALSFFVYRTSVGFNAPDFFLEGDSWHKLQQIFLLIEYCSLIIYLANVPPKWQGYCLATGISIIVIFQEKDSFDFKYALGPLIFNNVVFITANMLLDHPDDYNMDCVRYGGYWYAASGIGFLGMMNSWLNHYFIFDDLFVVCTCFSLFYCWQMYTDDTIMLGDLWRDLLNIKSVVQEYVRIKRREREEAMLYQHR